MHACASCRQADMYACMYQCVVLLAHSCITSFMHSMSGYQSTDTKTNTSVYDLASARNINCFAWLQHQMAMLKQ